MKLALKIVWSVLFLFWFVWCALWAIEQIRENSGAMDIALPVLVISVLIGLLVLIPFGFRAWRK